MSARQRFAEIAVTTPRCVWLDGASAGGWGGASIIAWLDDDDLSLTYDATTHTVTRHERGRAVAAAGDIFEALAAELASGPADARWFGYFGYASRADLPARPSHDIPDAVWMRPSHIEIWPVESAEAASSPEKLRRVVPAAGKLCEPDVYATSFAAVQEHLRAGDSYEVNLTYRVTRDSDAHPLEVYSRLRHLNPSRYAGFLKHQLAGAEAWLLSSSPECYATVTPDGRVTTRPIKGTTPRGVTESQDDELAERLRTDPRFRAENLMIVDLLRNDVATVADPGTVEVPSFQAVERHPAVHQLVSTVTGRLRHGIGTVDALRALFPPGSMTGAPKLRTMQIIDEVEGTPRGAYAGAFGYVDASGAADLGVVIRSLTTTGDGTWTLGTGGGITVHSPVDDELAETEWKAAPLLAALT